MLDAGDAAEETAAGRIAGLQEDLETERDVSQQALAQVELLNQQISALRRQLGALEAALAVSEKRDRESQGQIADLGRRLNVALAQRVQELSRYRSDFFGRLREILADRPDIEVVGDRFVLPASVLFPSGSDEIATGANEELAKLGDAILELEAQIPPEINWVIRVDGHTDVRPLQPGARFRSNWELSAARAIAVVRYLIERGVDPQHLVAAGFGEFQPLDSGDTEEALARNRRIELKLTER
jgi:chemotaxis protein MotB